MPTTETTSTDKPRQPHLAGPTTLRLDIRSSGVSEARYTLRLISSVGETIGILDFTERGRVPHIEWIGVLPAYRLQGHASCLLAALQARYPQSEINWGFMTEAGKALQRSLPTRQVPTEHAPSFARLKHLHARIAEISRDIQAKEAAGKDTSSDRQSYDRLARQGDELEYHLDRKRSHISVLDLGTSLITALPAVSSDTTQLFRLLENNGI